MSGPVTATVLTPHAMPRIETRDEALRWLARVAAPRGFRIACHLLRDRDEAEDMVQEALARAAAAYRSLDDPAALPAWFLRVTTNLCMRVLRRRQLKGKALRLIGLVSTAPARSQRTTSPAASEPGGLDAADPGPLADDQISFAADRTRLLAALDLLPAMQKAALVLRYGEGMSVADVASALGVGGGTVKTHLHRGLERLRTEMGRSR